MDLGDRQRVVIHHYRNLGHGELCCGMGDEALWGPMEDSDGERLSIIFRPSINGQSLLIHMQHMAFTMHVHTVSG